MELPGKEFAEDCEEVPVHTSDEEEEVVVKGSVLDQVFSSFRDDFEVFSPQQHQKLPSVSNSTPNTKEQKLINLDSLRRVKMLCTCGLMLEEDADMLYTEDLEHLDDSQSLWIRMRSHFLCLGAKVWHILSNSLSFVVGFPASEPIDFQWCSFYDSESIKLTKSLEILIIELRQTCDLAKKTNSIICDGFASLNSKVVELQLKLGKSETGSHYYQRFQSDLSSYAITYCRFIVNVVKVITSTTKRIMGLSECPNFYVASMLEDRLNSINASEHLSLCKINEIFNIFVIAQSEYLRALGLHLTSREGTNFSFVYSDVNILVNSIYELRKSSEPMLARGIYTRSFEKNRMATMKYNDSALSKLDSSLTLVLTETFELKDYCSKHDSISDLDVNILLTNIAKMKCAVEESATALQKICNIIRKQSDLDDATVDLPNVKEKNAKNGMKIIKTGIEVGKSDYKVDGGDHIYMCVIDDSVADDDQEKSDMFLEEDGSPVYPAPLIAELNLAVEKKRQEFEQREMVALKRSDLREMDVEFDLVVLHKPLLSTKVDTSSGTKTTKQLNHSDSVPVSQPPEPPVNEVDKTCSPCDSSKYVLQKNVAALAASKSLLWEHKEEEIIGDDDSS